MDKITINGTLGTYALPSSICDDYSLTNDYFSPSMGSIAGLTSGSITGATWVYPQATTLPYVPLTYGSPITSAGLIGSGIGSFGGMFNGIFNGGTIFNEAKHKLALNIVDAPKTIRKNNIKLRMKK